MSAEEASAQLTEGQSKKRCPTALIYDPYRFMARNSISPDEQITGNYILGKARQVAMSEKDRPTLTAKVIDWIMEWEGFAFAAEAAALRVGLVDLSYSASNPELIRSLVRQILLDRLASQTGSKERCRVC